MSSAAVRHVIALASELSEEERSVVVDAIAPPGTVAHLSNEWEAEIARRAERVRAGQSQGKPAEEVSIPETSSHPMWSRDRPPEKLRARKNPWPAKHVRRLGHSSLARRTHCSGSRRPLHGEVTPPAARTDDADRQRLEAR
jgi:hypothetical protein